MRTFAARLCICGLTALCATAALVGGVAAAPWSPSCGPRSTSPVFAPWLDPSLYFAIANGGLENGTTGWSLRGGSQVVAGNESFYVSSQADSKSLAVAPGGSVETAPMCIGAGEPTLRFFARNNGSILSTLLVEAHVTTTLLGIRLESWLPVGVVPGTSRTWQPSLPVLVDLSANQLLGGTTTVAFRFTPVLADASWQIDDVYVDPFKDR